MFEKIVGGFTTAKDHFRGRTVLNSTVIAPALQQIQNSLLEADVDYDVCQSFLKAVEKQCTGEKIRLKAGKGARRKQITPGDYFISACYEELKKIFGSNPYSFDLKSTLNTVMLVGLQGVGKTTTAGKLAKLLKDKDPLLVACDIYRPAAVEQLRVVAEATGTEFFFADDSSPSQICEKARQHAMLNGHEAMIIDTAGRLSIDEDLMAEISGLKELMTPHHTFLVVDAMMGQDAVKTAVNFQKSVDFDAVIMTKIDGDARGGAALSMNYITGKPIAFIGKGEGYEELEKFHPEGFSTRVLGLGDVVSLMDDFKKIGADSEGFDTLMGEHHLNFNYLVKIIKTFRKLGPLASIVSKLPGNISRLIPEGSETHLVQFLNIANSMTENERRLHETLTESRIKRIAMGSGIRESEVHHLVSRFNTILSHMQNHRPMDSHGKGQPAMFSPHLTGPPSPEAGTPQMPAKKRSETNLRKKIKQKRKASRKNRRK